MRPTPDVLDLRPPDLDPRPLPDLGRKSASESESEESEDEPLELPMRFLGLRGGSTRRKTSSRWGCVCVYHA